MMRSSSKRVARKGLELACFVGERLGAFPDEAGDFAFEWEEEGGEIDGAWVGGGDEDLIEEEHKVIFFFESVLYGWTKKRYSRTRRCMLG